MADKGSGISIDPELVRELANILDDTGLSEVEVEVGEMRVRVVRQAATAMPQVQTFSLPAPHAPAAPQPAPVSPAPSAQPVAAATAAGEVVKSPMVGTAFLQPSPGSEAFVKVGGKVKAGQTMLIIEAMKTMNPIPAPRDGTVLEILIEDAQPVEFGEPLVVIE